MTSDSIIDMTTFTALQNEVGADFVNELLHVYYDEVPQLLTELQLALEKKDFETFRRAAHSIKSTSNSFGALQFGLMAKELELMGRDRIFDGANDKVEALTVGYEMVRQTLEGLSHGK